MALTSGVTLEDLVAWLEAEDAHAGYHTALLREASELIRRPELWGGEEARLLAARLERWRYQHLRERQGQWTARDWELADLLDQWSRSLAGRPPLTPRHTFQAITSTEFDPPSLSEAIEALHPSSPLELVCAKARRLTEENFCVPRGDGNLPTAQKASGGDACGEEQAIGGESESSVLAATVRKRRMFMYAPLYLSSYCVNYCAYCGFRFTEPIERRHLTVAEARREAEALSAKGFRHILLVTGDYPQLVSTEYLAQVASTLCELGIHPGIEVAPLDTAGYETLVKAGIRSITLYQETYNLELYERYHPRGPKASYIWRLEALDRAAEAGIRRLGLGILLGLADPKEEIIYLVRHGMYLQRRFPDRCIAFSLPRIHEAPADFQVPYPVDDETFIRLYCALRIAFPTAELVLSTRENAELRDRLATICITQMSAGSSTAPGGYADRKEAEMLGRQFPVHDSRPAEEVFRRLQEAGLHLVWQID